MLRNISLYSAALAALALLAVPGALADRAYSDPAGDARTYRT